MLHLVYSITHPCINTTELHNVTCTLVATGVILRNLECIASLARSSILACAVAHSISGGFGRSEMYSGCRSQQSTEPAQLTEEAEIYTRCTFRVAVPFQGFNFCAGLQSRPFAHTALSSSSSSSFAASNRVIRSSALSISSFSFSFSSSKFLHHQHTYQI